MKPLFVQRNEPFLFISIHKNYLKKRFNFEVSAALSIRLTRLKARGPPRTGAQQSRGPCNVLEGGGLRRALPWVNTALIDVSEKRGRCDWHLKINFE